MYALSDSPISLVALVVTLLTFTTGVLLVVVVVGVPVLAAALTAARGWGRVERMRARVLLGEAVPEPEPRQPAGLGLTDPVGWRSLLYLLLKPPIAVTSTLLAIVVYDGLRAAIEVRRLHPDVGILVFSQYVEVPYARRLFAGGAQGLGYLLKDRISAVGEFVEALERVAAGGTALDPDVVAKLVAARGAGKLSPRESEVLELMAQGRSNAAIAAALTVTPGAVEKFVASIFAKLDLPMTEGTNRRVPAVLRYLQQ